MARILIIEDEQPVREMLRQMLERDGHAVHEAADGEQGIAQFREHAFDLVITDILMPTRGGLVVIKEIREARPDVPIIAISGGGRTGKLNFLSTAKTFEGVRTFRKPFRRAEILQAVAEMVGNP